MEAKYKRVLLKVSGEALAGENGFGLDEPTITKICENIKKIVDLGVQFSIVVGGGNIWRGRQGLDMDRVTADQMGMLATVINALAVSEAISGAGVEAKVLTSIAISGVGEMFNHKLADKYLKEGKVVVFGGGTGNPFFSTDTGASLKAAEIGADALLLAKNIDGIYDSDPKLNPNAKKFDSLTYDEYVERGLKAMDTSAVIMCKENGLKVHAFGLSGEKSILKAVAGDKEGTVIY